MDIEPTTLIHRECGKPVCRLIWKNEQFAEIYKLVCLNCAPSLTHEACEEKANG